MLADAVLAEGYRLLRSRTTWFWSVLFVPILGLVFAVIGNSILRMMQMAASQKAQDIPPQIRMEMERGVDLGQALLSITADLAGPATLLFVLIGAATLYAGDYRWETWRLISARNSRTNLVLGKIGALKALTLIAMLALFIAGVGQSLIKVMILALPLSFSFEAADAGRLALLFLLSFWRIIQFTMLGLLAAVMSRSLLAALFVPLVVGVMQFFSPGLLSQFAVAPDSWGALMVNPGAAADILKAAIAGGTAAALLPGHAVMASLVSLAVWMFAPLVGAIAWFNRQDLSKE
jgi:ABC-2 type transport system permease protein